MHLKLTYRSARLLAPVWAALLVPALGCGKAEQIQTYTVPKEPKAAAVANATDTKPGEPTDRMLAAILPANGQAWFFKAVGPIADVNKHEKELNDFFSNLTLAADGRANWKLPAGWKEEAGNQMRAATIVIPSDKRLEITVTKLPWQETQDNMLANVNRWRGQLQLPPIEAKQLPEVSHERKAGDRTMTIVDMRGRFKPGGMTPPFAGGGFGPRATGTPAANANTPAGLPAEHPPIDGPSTPTTPLAANVPVSSNVPKFTLAPSWKSVPAQGMRKAEFVISEGPHEARVTMFVFPADAGPMISEPLDNINRWRGEIGLTPLTKESLAAAIQPIEIDGKQATYAPMIPDTAKQEESQAKEATLAAILKTGDQVWFAKMRGERELVKKHEDEFKAFLKSLKSPFGNQAAHGNK